jgi:hypothetical protein
MVLVFIYPSIHDFIKGDDVYMVDPEFSSRINAFYGEGDSSIHFTGHNPPLVEKKIEINGTGTFVQEKIKTNSAATFVQEKIEINSADTLELMTIKGIGPVLSRRILRYREILGGYNDLSQLLEVYGIDKEKYLEISPSLFADTSRVLKLNLLSGRFGELLRHPYLDYEQVSEIFRLRKEGKLIVHDDLLQSPAFSKSDFKRLFPYLNID